MTIRTWPWWAFILVLSYPAMGAPRDANGWSKRPQTEFDISQSPQKGDWQWFHRTTERTRLNLLKYQRERGKTLADWAWEWRLGWAQACRKSKKNYCRSILVNGLKDKAMVVRAESATQLGRKFEGTRNPKVVSALTTAYANPRNYRNGKALYVQRRILFALKQIGGADQFAGRLAKTDRVMNQYWRKINL